MDETKISDTKVKSADPWLMDGGPMFYPSDFENLQPLPEELESKLNALADEIFGPVDEVQPAA